MAPSALKTVAPEHAAIAGLERAAIGLHHGRHVERTIRQTMRGLVEVILVLKCGLFSMQPERGN
jgi:hypothetical protein